MCKSCILCYESVKLFFFLLQAESKKIFQCNKASEYWITKSALEATVAINSERHESYQKWSYKERIEIGRYAAIYGCRDSERKIYSKEKPLNESSAHRFAKSDKEKISKPLKGCHAVIVKSLSHYGLVDGVFLRERFRSDSSMIFTCSSEKRCANVFCHCHLDSSS